MHIVDQWNRDWNLTPTEKWMLPINNYIIDDIIFASMYLTDSKLAYMENVLSNKNCNSETRITALGELGTHIFDTARELGFKAVLGWTRNKSVAANSAKHGMIVSENIYASMIKVL